LLELTESKSEIQFEPLPVDDPLKRQPDISLAQDLLGWKPETSRREGLAKTIAYFRQLSPEELRHKEHRTFN
jgi:dTDP-glucose 4,6-dehydratase